MQYKAIKHASDDIVKILSGGVLLWERLYRWEKYTLNKVIWIANLTRYLSKQEIVEAFPQYHDFSVEQDGSTIQLFGRLKPTKSNMTGVVTSPYRAAYPDYDMSGNYYYKFIG